jgi:hypothetical protein
MLIFHKKSNPGWPKPGFFFFKSLPKGERWWFKKATFFYGKSSHTV